MFDSIDNLLKKNQRANPNLLLSPQVCYLAGKIIKKILPETKNKIKIVSFKHTKLKIAADDSMLLHKIKMHEEEIINKTQEKIKIKRFRIIYIPKG